MLSPQIEVIHKDGFLIIIGNELHNLLIHFFMSYTLPHYVRHYENSTNLWHVFVAS